jgi:hypothetical protein
MLLLMEDAMSIHVRNYNFRYAINMEEDYA